MAMKTTLEIVQRIARNVHKYAKGGTYSYEGEGWSHVCGRKEVKFRGEIAEIKRLAERDDVKSEKIGRNYHIIYIDTPTDTEYDIVTEMAQYVGRSDIICVDVVYNATIANS